MRPLVDVSLVIHFLIGMGDEGGSIAERKTILARVVFDSVEFSRIAAAAEFKVSLLWMGVMITDRAADIRYMTCRSSSEVAEH